MTATTNWRRDDRIPIRLEAYCSFGRCEVVGVLTNISYSGALIEDTSIRPAIGTPVVLYVYRKAPSAFEAAAPFELAGRIVRHSTTGCFAIVYENSLDPDVRRMVNDAAASWRLRDEARAPQRAGGGRGMALKEGNRVFLRFDSPSRGRLLQPGIVQEIREGGLTLAFEARHLAVKAGEEKLVYYGQARDFVQQPVLVEAQSSDGPPFVLILKSIGDTVSVGTREEDRVSTSGTDLTATLEDEDGCLIQDVSLSGLAVISDRKYRIGRCLEVAIRYGDEEYVGQMEIRCVHAIDGEKTRYGLLGVFDTAEGRGLQNGLTRMTLEIQQQHLRRISG